MAVKGTLTGCTGENFTATTYVATLKTAAPVSCSALGSAGEAASGSAKYRWTPKKADATNGVLAMQLTEASGSSFSGEVAAPSAVSAEGWKLELTGAVTESYANGASCGAKTVKKGTFSGAGVKLLYHE